MNSLLDIMEHSQPREDATERKHGGNPQSAAAYERLRPLLGHWQQVAYDLVKAAGVNGVTLKECCARLGKTPNALSGRFTELSAELGGRHGLIARTIRRRDGCAVWVALAAMFGGSRGRDSR